MATCDPQIVVPETKALTSLGSLLQMQILGPYPIPTGSENLAVGQRICVLKGLLGGPGML